MMKKKVSLKLHWFEGARKKERRKIVQLLYLPDTENEVVNSDTAVCGVFSDVSNAKRKTTRE